MNKIDKIDKDIIESFEISTRPTKSVLLADPIILLTILIIIILFLYISIIRRKNN
jgi:hypothetical protein